jgi:hypothetical protein
LKYSFRRGFINSYHASLVVLESIVPNDILPEPNQDLKTSDLGAGYVAQAVERLLCKALSSKPRHIGKKKSRHQWLTPVILATQETEIRRIAV